MVPCQTVSRDRYPTELGFPLEWYEGCTWHDATPHALVEDGGTVANSAKEEDSEEAALQAALEASLAEA